MSLRCAFAAALRGWQGVLELELPAGADIEAVIAAARAELAQRTDLDASSVLAEPEWVLGATGVFGVVCERTRRVLEGERVELYRRLEVDPKEARRARARERQTDKGRNPLTVSGASTRRL